jgi:hypothetical protein
MKATIYRLAFELHKLPSEIYAMDVNDFSEMMGYLEESNREAQQANSKAANASPKPRVPQTMGG